MNSRDGAMADHSEPDQEGTAIKHVDGVLESTLESVDAAEARVLAIAEKAGFDEDEMHHLGMAVREAMVNAVVHGNKYSALKKVYLTIWEQSGGVKVIIADEGSGFDIARVPDPLAEENLLRESGRGILLMQAFVDELQVRRRSPLGTEVTMVKYRAGT